MLIILEVPDADQMRRVWRLDIQTLPYRQRISLSAFFHGKNRYNWRKADGVVVVVYTIKDEIEHQISLDSWAKTGLPERNFPPVDSRGDGDFHVSFSDFERSFILLCFSIKADNFIEFIKTSNVNCAVYPILQYPVKLPVQDLVPCLQCKGRGIYPIYFRSSVSPKPDAPLPHVQWSRIPDRNRAIPPQKHPSEKIDEKAPRKATPAKS